MGFPKFLFLKGNLFIWIRLKIQIFSFFASQPTSKLGLLSTKLVANGLHTTLYRRSSFCGRFWRLVYWVARSDKDTHLSKTIDKTTEALEEKFKAIQDFHKEMKNAPTRAKWFADGQLNVAHRALRDLEVFASSGESSSIDKKYDQVFELCKNLSTLFFYKNRNYPYASAYHKA